MIVINDNKVNVLHCRTNRRVKWQYAEYGGRYASSGEAIDAAKKHYNDQAFEYRIENMDTDKVITGLVNWKKEVKK